MNMIRFNKPAPKNNIVNVLDDFFNMSFGDVLDSDFSRKSPAINIVENENAYTIELAAPGLKKENFSINIEKDQLIISAKVESEKTEDTPKYKRREFNYSEFKKSFHLNKDIDTEKIDAKYENGVLRIALEKREEAKDKEPRVITVG